MSGGFDPIHSGHISYLKHAKKLGDILIVALNSDEWLKRKKGKYFMSFEERKIVLESMKYVDRVVSFEDDKIGSAINALNSIKNLYPNDKIIFCNGGDRTKLNIPEMSLTNIEFIFGVGGTEKMNSSSQILKKFKKNSVNRIWGNYEVLFEGKGIKVKKLIIFPGKGMSLQRHMFREEFWFIVKGSCFVNYHKYSYEDIKQINLKEGDMFNVPIMGWHQLINETSSECSIIEIQKGEKTIEEDIERIRYYDGN